MLRWIVIGTGLLACILIPFALLEEPLSQWTVAGVRTQSNQGPGVFLWIVGALAADVFLPIPSSIVSTLGGVVLGFPKGVAASWLGMTAGSVVGYGFGLQAGEPIVRKTVGEAELGRVAALFHRYGNWAIILSRPVPVLAEASVIAAGSFRMPFPLFLLTSSLANLGISAMYAYTGAAQATESFLLVLLAAIGLPGVAMLLMRWFGPAHWIMGSAVDHESRGIAKERQ
jgi:uncharacterized membrane protein YdjX (TVP38/TMEM64 family)